MRARMCHTSAIVILAYLLCWLPYNLISLAMCYEEHTIIYEIPAFSMKSKEVTYGSGRRQRKLI
uniref:G_PROTEIN_RECEP_F1_2 domain-containing protein n=1 Tax=Ascaris lumbricoides TaxID=6252 RepID=A0A0M3IEP6_ASCLU